MPAPESVAKKVSKTAAVSAVVQKRRTARAEQTKTLQALAMKRGRTHQRALKNIERGELNRRRTAKASGNFYVEPEARVAFAIRIRGICDVPPVERKILRLLRLRQIHNGVFVRTTPAMIQMLQRVNPYIAWGYPSHQTIKKLVLKRGYAKVNKQRIKLVNNELVNNQLGSHHDVKCVDDIIFQLATCGQKFKEITKFLWPFKLSTPRGGYAAKRKHFVERGDYGNREEYINRLIQRML